MSSTSGNVREIHLDRSLIDQKNADGLVGWHAGGVFLSESDNLAVVLDKFTQSLMTIARAELPEAKFSEDDKTKFKYKSSTINANSTMFRVLGFTPLQGFTPFQIGEWEWSTPFLEWSLEWE